MIFHYNILGSSTFRQAKANNNIIILIYVVARWEILGKGLELSPMPTNRLLLSVISHSESQACDLEIFRVDEVFSQRIASREAVKT